MKAIYPWAAALAALLAAALLTVARAQASGSIPELESFIGSQLSAQDAAMDASTLSTPAAPETDEWWARRLWIRIQAPAGINVPGTFKLQVTPELELYWERQYQDGWTTYDPRS